MERSPQTTKQIHLRAANQKVRAFSIIGKPSVTVNAKNAARIICASLSTAFVKIVSRKLNLSCASIRTSRSRREVKQEVRHDEKPTVSTSELRSQSRRIADAQFARTNPFIAPSDIAEPLAVRELRRQAERRRRVSIVGQTLPRMFEKLREHRNNSRPSRGTKNTAQL